MLFFGVFYVGSVKCADGVSIRLRSPWQRVLQAHAPSRVSVWVLMTGRLTDEVLEGHRLDSPPPERLNFVVFCLKPALRSPLSFLRLLLSSLPVLRRKRTR